MLTNAEKRFIEHWQEQRGNSKWKYYLQFTIAWTVVIFLSLFFILKLIMPDRNMGGLNTFYVLVPTAILLASIATHITFIVNEKRLKKIINREKSI